MPLANSELSAATLPSLRVSADGRSLLKADGTPFFYLADTAWELFHRLDRKQADRYLATRARQGFTVIQAVALAELDGLTAPNPYGHLPLRNLDPLQPVEEYFRHVDWVVAQAERRGLYIGMVPTWGDKWNLKWGPGPEIFTPENTEKYGEWIGRRYKDSPILWILDGDRAIESERHRQITRAMADGVQRGCEKRQLITFHPTAILSSSRWFHTDSWLDFNMGQTGHARDLPVYDEIARDWALSPAKPCLNGEPAYEHIRNRYWLEPSGPLLDALDVRKSLYGCLFAGACGHTYGCNEVWQLWDKSRKPMVEANIPWSEALQFEGATQVRHARRLLESRPFLTRMPDQSLLASEVGVGGEHVQALRDNQGTYAFFYLPAGKPVRVRLSSLSGSSVVAHWFDPRTGKAQRISQFPKENEREFLPPTDGPDWVLVLDDAARKYPAPGSRKFHEREQP
ncbi:MAG: glycoside hydrolase family 140 protein [Armatimonas sp.]